MSDRPVPCRQPFAMAECDRPLHHEGEHHATLTPPPHVQAAYDQALASLVHARRRASFWTWFFIISSGVQMIAFLFRYLEGVTP